MEGVLPLPLPLSQPLPLPLSLTCASMEAMEAATQRWAAEAPQQAPAVQVIGWLVTVTATVTMTATAAATAIAIAIAIAIAAAMLLLPQPLWLWPTYRSRTGPPHSGRPPWA